MKIHRGAAPARGTAAMRSPRFADYCAASPKVIGSAVPKRKLSFHTAPPPELPAVWPHTSAISALSLLMEISS